jgi:hypothetical protein
MDSWRSLTDALSGAASTSGELARENKALAVIGGVTCIAAAAYFVTRKSKGGYSRKPSSLQLTGGNVANNKIKAEASGPA